jgi:hypothetical protein
MTNKAMHRIKKFEVYLSWSLKGRTRKKGTGAMCESTGSYILLVLLGRGGGGGGVTRVKGGNTVKEDGQWDAPANSAS